MVCIKLYESMKNEVKKLKYVKHVEFCILLSGLWIMHQLVSITKR